MMIARACRGFACLLAFLAARMAVHAEAEAVISQARAYLGTEEALNAVTSVHYVGKLMVVEPTPAGPKESESAVEIYFQKPYRHRIVTTTSRRIEVAALNDYEGWQRVQDPANPEKKWMTLLPREQVKRLRANTWENLAFFKGIERIGGKLVDLGPATQDGVDCEKISFVHEDEISFTRYFEKATGRLVFTETEKGGSIREEGEIVVSGVRFPKKIVTMMKANDGKDFPVTVTIEQILVNEEMPGSLFEVPMFSGK